MHIKDSWCKKLMASEGISQIPCLPIACSDQHKLDLILTYIVEHKGLKPTSVEASTFKLVKLIEVGLVDQSKARVLVDKVKVVVKRYPHSAKNDSRLKFINTVEQALTTEQDQVIFSQQLNSDNYIRVLEIKLLKYEVRNSRLVYK